ncbi:glycoside hydrolase family 18 protein [Candidatus Gottesmanbacteria bacterium]|nr:glycoside hydrolase family 18 protein [Candidatus Gottesmanbacteria bacterium]
MGNIKKIIIILFVLAFGLLTGVIANRRVASPDETIELINNPLTLKSRKNIIGFMPFWLLANTKQSYKPYLTTFAYYALVINADGTIQKKVNDIEEEPGWTTFKKEELQQKLSQAKRDGLKTSLLIFTVDEDDIFELVQNPQISAQNFLADIIPIMKEYKFDDLNMDIESFVKTSSENQIKYASFLREVKKGMDENKLGTLTIDITPESLIKSRLTKAEYLVDIADYIVLMGYDFHFIYSQVTGPVAPIGGGRTIDEFDVINAVEIALQSIPQQKLILGIPLYGYEWDTIESNPRSAVIPFSGKTASTRRVEEILADCNNCTKSQDTTAQQPYLVNAEKNYYRGFRNYVRHFQTSADSSHPT